MPSNSIDFESKAAVTSVTLTCRWSARAQVSWLWWWTERQRLGTGECSSHKLELHSDS